MPMLFPRRLWRIDGTDVPRTLAAACPVCRLRFNSADLSSIGSVYIPSHGPTIDLTCPGGDKWYRIKPKSDAIAMK